MNGKMGLTLLVLNWPCIFLASPTYNVTITQIVVGGYATDREFHAIFDSGTSFTYLNDPAYTLISEKVSSQLYSLLIQNKEFHAIPFVKIICCVFSLIL